MGRRLDRRSLASRGAGMPSDPRFHDSEGVPSPTTERLFRAVVESAPNGVVMVDARGVIVLVNRETERLFGYTRDELIGQSVELLIPPQLRDNHVARRGELINHHQRRHMSGRDLIAVHKLGSQIPVQIGLNPVNTDEGTFVLASIIDIAPRKRAEEDLRTSEERFRQLADNIKEALIVIELPSYKPSYLSRVWAEIWGRSVDDARANPDLWFEAIHPSDRASVQLGQESIARGHPAENVFRVMRPDGSTRWVRARLFPVLDVSGVPYRMVGLVEDITEMRQTEEQLRQSQKMEAVGRLAGGIAHDFNNLLTAILGYAEFVLEELGPNHPSVADVREIQAAGQSAANLTRQLLAFSRRQILQPHTIDLNDVIRRVQSLLARIIGEDVTLHLKLTGSPATVTVDPAQVEQVVMNLAVNARDAMRDGGFLTIETSIVDLDLAYVQQHRGASTGNHVMLAVSDTGVGMDEATQQHLFEPFFTTKETGKGTGLGLATVYGIIKQSHGSIWVYSERGKGSTFKIYLPLAVGESPQHILTEREPVSWNGTETVLVVEDQSEARSVIRETLRRRGYTVIEAASGPEAIVKSAEHTGVIHLLLTDVILGGMGGRRVAETLRSHRPGLRVLYMSGYTDDAIVHHGVLEPGLAFVQKPFTAELLLRRVRAVLDAAADAES
jgi:PAS domain S-box-containing protein